MGKMLKWIGALLLLTGAAFGQTAQPTAVVVSSCASATFGPAGRSAPLTVDQTGQVCNSSNAIVTGNVASGATDSGNPVKVGGVYNSTPPTLTNGQRGDAQVDAHGNIRALFIGQQVSGNDGQANNTLIAGSSFASQPTGSAQPLIVAPSIFNGLTWDRQFTCTNTAAVSVTAGSTTEIVGLTASQVIRVCGFSVSMSAAGTAQFVYGTGTNCGTGTTSITGATPLATGTPWSVASGNGSVFRTASANALCVAAVTGNVVGFVTYAKY